MFSIVGANKSVPPFVDSMWDGFEVKFVLWISSYVNQLFIQNFFFASYKWLFVSTFKLKVL